MCKAINYSIDLDGIKDTFKFTENGLTNKQGVKFKLLPYSISDKNPVLEFSGVIGEFSRLISDKELSSDFNVENFLEEVSDQIGEYEGDTSKEVFKDIIRSMFIDSDRLVDFDIKTMNYISSEYVDNKVASFLYSVLFDDSLKEEVKRHYNREIDNILYKVVFKSLPELKNKKKSVDNYKCYLPFVRERFIKDFNFILSNEDLYRNSLQRLLEYYYTFYVSQLIMKLDEFECADLDKPSKLYYTLDWERTSKTRTAYQFGWEKIKHSLNSLLYHAVTLELLNHTGIEGRQLGYKELAELFYNIDSEEIEIQIETLITMYIDSCKHVKSWNEFNYNSKESKVKGFDSVNKLFSVVKYQFENSARKRAKEAYKNCFEWFVQKNFAKRRGQLGYNLNITEDDIILMTKICINNNEKLKLNDLFEEFELRGLFFDRDSKLKIIQLYEKLNLLEKKSDSGDAQYVNSVL